jgi:HEAT repeat protein
LKDEDWDVRKAAVQHPNATAEHVSQALKDEDWDVRKAAEEAKKRLKLL